MNNVNGETNPSDRRERVKRLVRFLNTLPDNADFVYQEDGKWWATNEWLCGTFAGRGFTDATKEGAVGRLLDYFDEHTNHASMVGSFVTESGWPNLDRVKLYLIHTFYAGPEET